MDELTAFIGNIISNICRCQVLEAEMRREHEAISSGMRKRHTFERLDSLIDAVVGKRITWKELTA
jgi:hypothetical protein